jgi:hypothetical protein
LQLKNLVAATLATRKSRLQLHLQLQKKMLIATTLATKKYFITKKVLFASALATIKNLSCNSICNCKKLSVAIILTTGKKSSDTTQNISFATPHN